LHGQVLPNVCIASGFSDGHPGAYVTDSSASAAGSDIGSRIPMSVLTESSRDASVPAVTGARPRFSLARSLPADDDRRRRRVSLEGKAMAPNIKPPADTGGNFSALGQGQERHGAAA
jgi:hypothetical protein